MTDDNNRRLDVAVATALGHKVEITNGSATKKFWTVDRVGHHEPLPRYSTELCQAWPLIREAQRRWRTNGQQQRLINFVKELPKQPFNFKEDVLATAICAAFTQAAS
jgi:hypothetical protein